jgi:hypothetical protein
MLDNPSNLSPYRPLTDGIVPYQLSTAFRSVSHCEMETGPATAYLRQEWEASPPSSGFSSMYVSGRNASYPRKFEQKIANRIRAQGIVSLPLAVTFPAKCAFAECLSLRGQSIFDTTESNQRSSARTKTLTGVYVTAALVYSPRSSDVRYPQCLCWSERTHMRFIRVKCWRRRYAPCAQRLCGLNAYRVLRLERARVGAGREACGRVQELIRETELWATWT